MDFDVSKLNSLILKPIIFNGLKFTLIDALQAYHPSGWQAPQHRHPWFEFNYVSKGKLFTGIEGVEFTASEGEFFLIIPGAVHYNMNKTPYSDDGFCLRWQMELCDGYASKNDSLRFSQDCINVLREIRGFAVKNKLIHIFMESIMRSEKEYELQMCFLKLIFDLYAIWKNEKDTCIYEETEKITRDDIIIKQVLIYLEEYFNGPVNVNNIAKSMNVSYRNLSRIFKNRTGITIVEKLNDIRINNAKILLVKTDKTI